MMTEKKATPGRSLGGRFSEATHPVLARINRSVDVDKRMWRQDIQGSLAHAGMLASVQLISQDDYQTIDRGLHAVAAEFESATFVWSPDDEDIHMAVERRLGELIGEPAQRLHTGRSRNDQVMTDVMLWIREALIEINTQLTALAEVMLHRAREGVDVPMPSFTHSQPAQVSSVAQWLCAHAAEIADHHRRLTDLQARLASCPLGSGASAGSYLPIDRQFTASALGFAAPSVNSIQSTGGRTDLLDVVALVAMIGTSLSRLGEEMVWWSSPAFSWLRLPDRLATGSSLLPHKRNPDGAELIRGAGKMLAGDFAAFSALIGGLQSGYSKDLQYDKVILFRVIDTLNDVLSLTYHHIESLQWDAPRLAAACGPELSALWLADRLVLAGMPFRAAHHVVGLSVRLAGSGALAEGFRAWAISHPEAAYVDEIALELSNLTSETLMTSLRSQGGASPASTRQQMSTIAHRLGLMIPAE